MRSRTYAHCCYALPSLLLAVPPVFAADDDFYVGASVSNAATGHFRGFSIGTTELGRVLEGSAFKIVGGLRPFQPLAFEVSYVDFGRRLLELPIAGPAGGPGAIPTGSNPTLDSHAVSVSALGLYTVRSVDTAHPVDLFGRVGLARWQSVTSNLPPGFANGRREGTDPSFGVGAQVKLSKVALRIEYEGFKLADDTTNLLSFGFTYHFR